jgi:hypothetical protein
LHKCGQITLDELDIYKNEDGDEPIFANNAEMKLPLEEVPPISQNITSFQKISIRFVPFFLPVQKFDVYGLLLKSGHF